MPNLQPELGRNPVYNLKDLQSGLTRPVVGVAKRVCFAVLAKPLRHLALDKSRQVALEVTETVGFLAI